MNRTVREALEIVRSKFEVHAYTIQDGLFSPIGKYEEFMKDAYDIFYASGASKAVAQFAFGHVVREKNRETVELAILDFANVIELMTTLTISKLHQAAQEQRDALRKFEGTLASYVEIEESAKKLDFAAEFLEKV